MFWWPTTRSAQVSFSFSLKFCKPFRFREACLRRFWFKAERKRQKLSVPVFAWLQVLSMASAVVESVSAKTSTMVTHVIRRIATSFLVRQFANRMQNL